MSNDNKSLVIGTTAGAIGGSLYGFYHPSEKTLKKLADINLSVVDTMKEYRDSFNLSAAKNAVAENKLNLKEYSIIDKLVNAIEEFRTKEQAVHDIINTPIKERTKTYSQAVKESNNARFEMHKQMFTMSKDFQKKLTQIGVFDFEKFEKAFSETLEKMLKSYKELSKGALKGLGIGALIGLGSGLIFNFAVNKAKKAD